MSPAGLESQPKLKQLQDAFDVSSEDIIIAVMGPTGAGKSKLIETFDPTGQLQISKEQLQSHTDSISAYRLSNHPRYGKKIVLVDTPGFNDTKLTDMEVLKRIAKWLEKTYRSRGHDRVLISGIIYLHNISSNRMTGATLLNLKMFGQLCGSDAAKNVVLVSTMWNNIVDAEIPEAEEREKRLKETYWKELLRLGSRVERSYNNNDSVQLILSRVVEMSEYKRLLLLQDELVNLGKPIKETKAGTTLLQVLQITLKEAHETLTSLFNEQATAADPKHLNSLAEGRQRLELQVQQSRKELDELKSGFLDKFKAFFKFKKPQSRAVKLGD